MTKKYKFSVGPGNNSELVRRTFLRRPWWEEVSVDDDSFDCHWRQVRSRELAEKVKKNGNKQFLNHHQGLNCLCRKSELYKNLKNYFISQSRNVHEIVPQTYIITVGEYGTDMAEFTKHCKMLETKQRAQSPSKASSTTSESDALSNASTVPLTTPSKSAVTGRQPPTAATNRSRPSGAVRQPLPFGSSTTNKGQKLSQQTARRANGDVLGEIVQMQQPLNDEEDLPTGYTSEQESSKRGQTPPRGMRASASPPKMRVSGKGALDLVAKGDRPPIKSRAPPSSSGSRVVSTMRDSRSAKPATALAATTTTSIPSTAQSAVVENQLPKARGVSVPAWGVGKNSKNPKLTEQEKKRLSLSKWNPASDWSEKQESNNMWIVKPTNSNRGNGIQVFSDLRAIEANLQKRGNGYCAIVQKYIERPLLIHERKFDIRQLVFVDNNMKVYRYNRPYIRTSSTAYDTNNLEDRFVHLTNYSVQKYSDACNAHEEGNNMSMSQFQQYIDQYHASAGISVDQHIIGRIESIIADTMRAVQNKLNPFRDPNSFELYGYDFLIDEDFKVWLLEVNTNPYIGFSSTMLSEIFTGMMEGIFRLVVDTAFPPPPSAGPIEDVPGSDGWKLLPLERKPNRPTGAAAASVASAAASSSAVTASPAVSNNSVAPLSTVTLSFPSAGLSSASYTISSPQASSHSHPAHPPPVAAPTPISHAAVAPIHASPAPAPITVEESSVRSESPVPVNVVSSPIPAAVLEDNSIRNESPVPLAYEKNELEMEHVEEEMIVQEEEVSTDDGDLEYSGKQGEIPEDMQDLVDMAA